MSRRRIKHLCFTLEGVNSFAATFYFNYLFFFLRDNFHYDSRQNLWLSALYGLVYIFAAIAGGRFGQKHGYFKALKVGYGGAAAAMLLGTLFTDSIVAQYFTLLGFTVMICFTWPALEALVSSGESDRELPRMIGLYNVVWATTAALAYFSGGAIFAAIGWKTMFWLPGILFALQYFTVLWLEPKTGAPPFSQRAQDSSPSPRPGGERAGVRGFEPTQSVPNNPLSASLSSPRGGEGRGEEALALPGSDPRVSQTRTTHTPDPAAALQPISPQTFLKMAWLGNPVGYIAGNTVIATIPAVAGQLHLSVAASGLFCSIWLFARVAAFFALWHWTAWHYRFRWLVAAFVVLIASFFGLLLAHNLWVLVLVQLGFGAAVGLLYYSSLFYSMDVGEHSQGEHGGIHEAFIGAGVFAGTATGASALQFLPQSPTAGTWAVGALLACGLAGLFWLRQTGRRRP